MEKLIVSTSPHTKANNMFGSTVKKTMLNVILALCPALIMGVVFFGLYALLIVLLCVGSCILGEFLYNLIVKKKHTLSDLSAVVTGLILGLNLPPAVPFYVPIVGGLFAIMVVKMLFGGLGKNFANPAATARIFLLLTWAAQMTTYVPPLTYAGNNIFSELTKYFSGIVSSGGLDGMTAATPLSPNYYDMNILHLFLGNVGGSIGETSAIALIIGGIYLCVTRIIDWKIPVIFLGSFAVFTIIFTGTYESVLPQMLSGGLMLAAFFMATDYSTSPNTRCGTIIFALGLGFLTVILRQYTSMPEGVSYAIVLMNLVVPLLDKYIIPHPFGSRKKPVLMYTLLSIMGAMVIAFTSIFAVSYVTLNSRYKEDPRGAILSISDNGGNEYTYTVRGMGGYTDEGKRIGYVVLKVQINGNTIAKVEVSQSDQSPPQYSDGLKPENLQKYEGKELTRFSLGENIDAAAGATMTSQAICNAMNLIYENHQKAGVILAATHNDGEYIYTVKGYGGYQGNKKDKAGYVTLNVTVKNNVITKMEVAASDQSPPQYSDGLKEENLQRYVGKRLTNFKIGENVDAAAGATMTSTAICNALNEINKRHPYVGGVQVVSISDGEYTYRAIGLDGFKGQNGDKNGYVILDVKIKDDLITGITVVDHDQSPPAWNSAFKPEYLQSFVGKNIKQYQTKDNFDAATGGTYTSNAIYNTLNGIYERHKEVM